MIWLKRNHGEANNLCDHYIYFLFSDFTSILHTSKHEPLYGKTSAKMACCLPFPSTKTLHGSPTSPCSLLPCPWEGPYFDMINEVWSEKDNVAWAYRCQPGNHLSDLLFTVLLRSPFVHPWLVEGGCSSLPSNAYSGEHAEEDGHFLNHHDQGLKSNLCGKQINNIIHQHLFSWNRVLHCKASKQHTVLCFVFLVIYYNFIWVVLWFYVLCLLTCFLIWSDLEKALAQMRHWKGFNPACFLLCLVSSSDLENLKSHSVHGQLYGFSPVWAHMWAWEMFKWSIMFQKKYL